MLTWNLFHGRSVPPAGRPLLSEYEQRLASWSWDVALLQEVPPWWPPLLAEAANAEHRTALTSRNAGLPIRRAIARRWPDFAKSNGGGCNAVLSRVPILAHDAKRLRAWPERRVGQLVRVSGGVCFANLHASTRPGLAREEVAELCDLALRWSNGSALVLGGDLNLRHRQLPLDDLPLGVVARSTVDFLLARGLAQAGPQEFPDRTFDAGALELSDHRALAVALAVGD